MIKLGEGWIAEDLRIFHECGAGVRAELLPKRERCDCGASIPRRVHHFEGWLASGQTILHDALLDDRAVAIEDPEPEV